MSLARFGRGFSSLEVRNYRLYFFGQLISLIGTWMEGVAQAWLVLTLTNDPVALGVRSALQFLPVMILGLFGGILADALPKRRTLYFTQGTAATISFVVWALVLTGQINIWEIYFLAACLGVVNSVDMPVRQAFVVEMVGREHLVNAVALNSAVFNSARILGPSVAGALIVFVGLAPCFFINGCSFVAVIFSLYLMRAEELMPGARMAVEHSVRGVFGQLGEGLRYIRGTPPVLIAIATLGIVSTVALNFSVVIPLYAADTLHGNAGTYGALMAASGVGSLCSALFIAFQQRPDLRMLVLGAALVGAALIALSFSSVLAVSMLIMALLGASVILMSATTNTLIQLAVPDQLRGRVLAVYTTVFAGSTPIGGLLAGLVTGATNVAFTLLAAGVVTVVTAGGALTRVRAGPQGGRPVASESTA
ncbi:MAG TPA: MFS transporter [Candidatus Limnocylindrales bacterium]|jgi:MFS family permease|nr:MFS transporter [Candidatus Limnocylindrales bacterium]